MADDQPGDAHDGRDAHQGPLHGLTLEAMLTALVDAYGWDGMYDHLRMNCFQQEPSIRSSLKFLRRTPWARAKLESLYLWHLRELKRQARRSST
ncbi:MAG: VF530 family protein [Myxococcota bacterium]